MTLQSELASWNPWNFPDNVKVASIPAEGDQAPSNDKLTLPMPNGRPVVISFLRHCGCPFAEKAFRQVRDLAKSHPQVMWIAVSHSDDKSTETWLESVGGSGEAVVIVDPERELYAAWGLGPSSFWHVLSPSSLLGTLNVGRYEGIYNKPTESGSRWQTAGSFAVSGDGKVSWVKVSQNAPDVPDLKEGLQALKLEGPDQK